MAEVVKPVQLTAADVMKRNRKVRREICKASKVPRSTIPGSQKPFTKTKVK